LTTQTGIDIMPDNRRPEGEERERGLGAGISETKPAIIEQAGG